MSDRELRFEELCTALDVVGLFYRGGFHPAADDHVPSGTATLILVGNAGQAMWHAFQKGCSSGEDPLNEWTRRVLSDIAKRFAATTIFPFDGPPYAPFFAWARHAEAVANSPIGMLIHSEFGLWNAWRWRFRRNSCYGIAIQCRVPATHVPKSHVRRLVRSMRLGAVYTMLLHVPATSERKRAPTVWPRDVVRAAPARSGLTLYTRPRKLASI